MNKSFLARLFKTFDEMEAAIDSLTKTMVKKGVASVEVLKRFDQYQSIIQKQRQEATALEQHFAEANWNEVTRSVTIISALSAMIRDDTAIVLGKFSELDSPVEPNMVAYQ